MPGPYTAWEVRLVVAPYGTPPVSKQFWVQTLNSANDWTQGTLTGAAGVGACNDYANYNNGTNPVAWKDQTTGADVKFWELSGITNSQSYNGSWTQTVPTWSSQASVDSLPQVVLDAAVVNDLLTNANNRGLRLYGMWGAGDANARVAALGQWGSGGGARLALYAVPEPTTLLLALSGLALVRRRKA